ncbi:hypothetical protein HPB51_028856 [Rhipicephalus microplus]|uniref:Uncharacterized protein n=1 Tax=Rhipicephalus microplus TaxID=6941 RepID=A0A9J6CWP5_RHIMP|nr:hypothetical protein HPB51_028856 [Rhipicephalus microplus]
MDSERLELCYFCRSSPFVIGDGAASGIGRARKQCLDHDRSWPPSHPAIDVILMCLRIDSSDSCVNIMGSEKRQLHRFCGSVPVLVGIRQCFLEQPSHVLGARQCVTGIQCAGCHAQMVGEGKTCQGCTWSALPRPMIVMMRILRL